MSLKQQTISQDVLLEKYAKGNEATEDGIFKRVADGLAKAEEPKNQAKYSQIFYENMKKGGIGAGRIMSSAGTDIKATLINCFVQPVGDCIQGSDDDGYPGIYDALREAAETMRRGGGVGYNFSHIRPKNAFVKGTHSYASGPCSYMDVFDASCRTVESAGARRGAQMGILRIDHPDILEFITAKRTPGRWNNFNVSVGVTGDFMKAVANNESWDLVHKAEPSKKLIEDGAFYSEIEEKWTYETVQAIDLWDAVMRSAYDFAEPGIIFLDNINQDNNLHYCENIEATNPCGEQPLSPYACCDLGPVILTKFVRDPFTSEASFDWASFEEVVAVQVRMLDNVLETTHWPLEEQKIEAMNKRRVGVGFTGLGDALIMLGIAYNSEEGCAMGKQIAKVMRNNAYLASVELAIERGPFPLFDAQKYLDNGHSFASRLPDHIKDLIRKHGIRNSHLLSIAPTGTVSLAFADNASNGLEPAFSWFYDRKKRMQDGSHSMYRVEDHAYRVYRELGGDVTNLPPAFVSALEMSVNDHLAMMKAIQPYIDTSLSKTVNIPADYPYEDFKSVYMQAWKAGLKGCATYRPNNILGSVLSVAAPAKEKKPEPQALEDNLQNIDPNKVVIEKRPEGALNAVAEKLSYYTKEGKKSLYLNISFMPVEGVLGGKKVVVDRPVEFFIPVGQAGESQQWISSAMRLLSLSARGGMLSRALNDMRKVVDNQSIRLGEKAKEDGTLIPQFHDSEVAAIAFAIQRILIKRGLMNEDGEPLVKLSAHITSDVDANATLAASGETQKVIESVNTVMAGKKCPECGAHAVIKKDGCEYCTSCGHIGSCG
ncbi:adenosylcobalamin-dependent ribonucleoside-diphosphate reductase [Polynucleobacter sp. JS-Safj-400b-B2]|uniref:adenosylcobalamin-dependent ribonucleoside-diphosphate reductase n=1 Tax=Polynucleobacter sp. JS-Safj-400b-B2 TaxID=2576921 RepID=UPI001C0C6203|nr:adenosylcobalamin-dependent ribonucleoside-diphosphate reductase [Polynucleobacter sp. JS-Safj-400b-B2]MBU3625843.1 adenosylcobalamin-dependent ribonucleoside-diphosphate reductase [Polynucleobacter sp. JS-Safj-400b-B2]